MILYWIIDAVQAVAIGGLLGSVVAVLLVIIDSLSDILVALGHAASVTVSTVGDFTAIMAVAAGVMVSTMLRGTRLDAWLRSPWRQAAQKAAAPVTAAARYVPRHGAR